VDVELMDLFATASVISAAQQTGLLRALQSGPQTAQAYAEELGVDRRAAGLVLDALVTMSTALITNPISPIEAALRARAAWKQVGSPPVSEGDA
jgi:hypothetical protein